MIEHSKGIDLHELYKFVSDKLNLSPSQHGEKTFRQILGGCSAIISGLGCLRNDLGDAHGQGKAHYRPLCRHAELAVNLSGAMCSFLLETYEARKKDGIL
ncbi:abortive infection family protein [Lutispora sp.]|uniref:abortive infection family protein n=1 Tax=Lutispora sp. TaxID=2828727 RepID=UPI003568917F